MVSVGCKQKPPGISREVKGANRGCFIKPVTSVGNWATKDRDDQQERVTYLRVSLAKGKGAGVSTHQLLSATEKHYSSSLHLQLESSGSFLLNGDAWVPPPQILS